MSESSPMIELDKIDKEILTILQDDAKISLREIEHKIHLSTTAIRARIKRLTENNIIKKYRLIIHINLSIISYLSYC